MLAHAVLAWCGVRTTGLTTGQLQDNYRTTTGQLQDTVLQPSLPSGHASGHWPAPPCHFRDPPLMTVQK